MSEIVVWPIRFQILPRTALKSHAGPKFSEAFRTRSRKQQFHEHTKTRRASTANLRTEILDFRGFDSNTILNLRGGILMSEGDFLEHLSRAVLAGIVLAGRLGVRPSAASEEHQKRLRWRDMNAAQEPAHAVL